MFKDREMRDMKGIHKAARNKLDLSVRGKASEVTGQNGEK